MSRVDVRELVELLSRGELSQQAVEELLARAPLLDLGFARLDTGRGARQGVPEAVLAEGKSPQQVAAIVAALLEGGSETILVTRAGHEVHQVVGAGSAASAAELHANWKDRAALSAVRQERLVFLDADTIQRPTLRLADGVAQMCAGLDRVR